MKADRSPLDPMDQILRSRLHDSQATQAPSWDRFVAHKNAKTTTHTSIRRRIYHIGSVAAILVLLLTAGIYMFKTGDVRFIEPSATVQPITSKNTLGQPQTIIAQRTEPSTVVNPKKRLSKRTKSTIASQNDIQVKPLETSQEMAIKNRDTDHGAQKAQQNEQSPKNTKEDRRNTKPRSRISSPYDEPMPGKKRRSALAVGAYSSLGYGSQETTINAAPSMVMYTVGKYSGNMEVAESQFKHKFPITVGIDLQYNLGKGFNIHSGVTYSYLESTASRDINFQYNYARKSHYIGIPVGISYSVFENRRIDLYASVGAMAEWAVSSKLTSTLYSGSELISKTTVNNKVRGAIFSANAALGVNVKITQGVGIYLEPGVSHYFNNEDHPVNFRTQWPVQFSLRAGIRVQL